MPKGQTIKLEPIKVATMIANGMTQEQISQAHLYDSTSTLSKFMAKHLPSLRRQSSVIPPDERAKAWLAQYANVGEIAPTSAPIRGNGHNAGVSRSHYFQSYEERRGPKPRSLSCPYYIAKSRKVCGAHRGHAPYCEAHMAATAPLVVRV